MHRRRYALLAVSAITALTITTMATAGALAPTAHTRTTKPVTIAQPAMAAASYVIPAPGVGGINLTTQAVSNEIEVTRHNQEVAAALTALVQARFDQATAEAVAAVQTPMWSCIRSAESNDQYSLISGAYGILISTWWAFQSVWAPLGNWSTPGEAPPAVQDLVAYHLYQVGGGFGGWHNRCTGIN